MINGIQYEVINKETTETYLVRKMTFGEGYVDAEIGEEYRDDVIRFENINKSGNLTNDFFAIRTVNTHEQADGTGHVDNNGENIND